jgi:DivIVA domain-containing protein
MDWHANSRKDASMFTPDQLSEISFPKARFGGYDMNSVDAVLAPLTEDYIAIYNENERLKSKMRSLIKKYEGRRVTEENQAASAEKTKKVCDQMLRDAEAKRAEILARAQAEASRITKAAEETAAATVRASAAVEENPVFVEAVNKGFCIGLGHHSARTHYAVCGYPERGSACSATDLVFFRPFGENEHSL